MQTMFLYKVLKLPVKPILLEVFWSCPLPLLEKGSVCMKNSTLVWNIFE